jgi:hypothetical protein
MHFRVKKLKYHEGFSARSIFLLALLILVSLLSSFHQARAADLKLVPSNSSGSYSVGQVFTVPVFVSTKDSEAAMNAVSGVITFPKNILELISLDKNGSIVDFWIGDNSLSNNDGKAHIEGGVYTPGYSGSNGKIISLVFKAKAVGTGTISFASATVLANDGQGTNILDQTGTAAISVKAGVTPEVTANTPSDTLSEVTIYSSTHPDQNAWYTSTAVSLSWRLIPGTVAIRTALDKSPSTIPTVISSPPLTDKDVTVTDGVSYFHLQARDATGWGRVAHFRIQVDTAAVDIPRLDALPGRINEGDKLYITGKAQPDVQVTVFVTGSGETSQKSAQSDASGNFSIVWSNKLPPDAYTINAKATNARGIDSAKSPNVLVVVQESGITRIGWPILNIITIFILVSALIALIIIWLLYLSHRISGYRRRVRAEVKEADRHIHAKFKKLEDAVIEQIRLLREDQSKRKLTSREEKIITALGKFIEDAEEDIESEVENIGR